MSLIFLQLVIQETTVSAQGVSKAPLCSDPKAADGVWQEGCIVRTCKSGAVEESLADECVQLIEKIVEEKIVEKLAVKDPSYLYLDSTTIVDMNTLQFLPCQQDFPAELSYFWSQAAVVPHNGQDRLMVCGGPDMTGCFVWTSASGWQSLNTTSFKYRSQAASSMMARGGWLVTGGSVGRLDGRGFNRSSSVLLYSNNYWEELTNVPEAVCCHCQVTVGDTVYIIGGRNSSNDWAVSTVYKLSDGIWTQHHSLNRARWGHTCAVLDNTVYVIGGSAYDSVEMLSLDSNSWVYGPSLPGDAYDAQTVVYNDKLYVFETKGMIYRYDRRQDLWEDLSNTEFILLPFNERIVFPAPLLTEEQLPCK